MLAVLAWFALIILPHLLLTLAGHRDVVPPHFLAGIGRLAGLSVCGEGVLAPGKTLLLSNHVSWLDIPALAGTARTAFVAKSNLADQPFLRWLCQQNDTVFVTRDQRGTVARQVDQVRAAIGRPLVIFPEGTTGNGRELAPFRSSLLAAAKSLGGSDLPITVQPVALDYAHAAQIAWSDQEHGLHNVLRVLARTRRTDLVIRFLDPLSGEDLDDRKKMAIAAHERIAAALRL